MGEEVAVATMRSGVNDYLTKDNLSRLGPAIDRELREAQSRRTLREAELSLRRLAAVVQSSGDAIISTTTEDVITSWNPAAERLFGWHSAEALGRSIEMIVPPERKTESADILDRLKHGEQAHQFESIRVGKDGRRIDVSVTLSPIQSHDGRIVGVSRIMRNITDETGGGFASRQ